MKGKGQMQTFWLVGKERGELTNSTSIEEKKALLSYGIKEIDDSTKRP